MCEKHRWFILGDRLAVFFEEKVGDAYREFKITFGEK